MKTRFILLAASIGLFVTAPLLRAEEAKTPEALEAKFKETMTNVIMSGRNNPLKDGELGPEKADSYNIVGVEKTGVDSWIINAKMKSRQGEFVAPIPVQVKWAGDTAVLVIDKLQIPGPKGYGGAAYSARVLIHDNTYAGTWSAGDHGGLISGVIKKAGP